MAGFKIDMQRRLVSGREYMVKVGRPAALVVSNEAAVGTRSYEHVWSSIACVPRRQPVARRHVGRPGWSAADDGKFVSMEIMCCK